MVTHTRKPLEEYFATVLDRIEYNVRCNPRTGQVLFFASVPSESSDDFYMVGLDEHDNAAWCDCGDHCYRHNICKHMLAVAESKRIAEMEAAAIENDKTFEQATADFIVCLDTFYAQRGEDIKASKIDDAPLNGNANRKFSEASKGAASIEEGLGRRRLLR